jgi:ribonuclease G
MSKEILINANTQEKRVAILEDGRLEEFYIERPQDRTIVGNIYKGLIESCLVSINGAFVNIGIQKKGFLYLSELEYNVPEPVEREEFDVPQPPSHGIYNIAKKTAGGVKKGDEILVQVVKESFGRKGPRLSTNISIPGRYLVFMPQVRHFGISRRIEDTKERQRLRAILKELKLPAQDSGFIVRTAAAGRSRKEIERDASFLFKLWQRIKLAARRKAPALIHEEYDLVLRTIRDSFTDDVKKLIVDCRQEYRRIQRFVRTFLRYLSGRVQLYRGGQDLFHERDIERQINKIFENRIYLKSKGYVIIEPTEGLVVVDVNSGSFKKSSNPEETAFRVNCDAAAEIARQLRLRDLGGIIVIDFIDMQKPQHRKEVFSVLNKALSKDRAKYDCLGISKFGLVEMTRERIHRTVSTLSYQDCPYCLGRGRIKSTLTMSIIALKELKRYLKAHQLKKEVNLILNPAVVPLVQENKKELHFIQRYFRSKINIISNPTLHLEEIKIT